MPLTGLQIFKLLPNTNCRKCGYPTCLAFAMKLAAGKESLEKCPDASPEARAALGAASAPPIRGVTIGRGERAVTVGEETVFFRHEKTFVRRPGLFRVLDPQGLSASRVRRAAGPVARECASSAPERRSRSMASRLWKRPARPRPPPRPRAARLPGGRCWRPRREGAAAMAEPIKDQRPLLVPPAGAAPAAVRRVGRAAGRAAGGLRRGSGGPRLSGGGGRQGGRRRYPAGAARRGLARTCTTACPPSAEARSTAFTPAWAIRFFSASAPGEFEKAVLGITKFASVLAIEDHGGETWLPLWTLRQNIYTDPQKPLQMEPGMYPIGEPDSRSPLLVTTNFSLTYFIVSTEVEAAGVAAHLAVVDAEGLSVLTAWSAGKLSGDRVAKSLRQMGAAERVSHRTVIIPGYASVISGELEDALGDGWRVLVGPQEASDIAPFFRDVWGPRDKPPNLP